MHQLPRAHSAVWAVGGIWGVDRVVTGSPCVDKVADRQRKDQHLLEPSALQQLVASLVQRTDFRGYIIVPERQRL